MRMNDRWILFDLGNTLYDETLSDYERVCKLINNNNLSISIDEFMEQMRLEAKRYAESPFTSARKHFGIGINQEYSGEKEILFDGVRDVLQELSQAYHLGVLANQPSSTLERLKRDNIYSYFEVCLLSDIENMKKPDIRFFEYALDKIKCKPENVIMVGDRLDNDIMPAKKVGMKTIRIRQGLSEVQEPMDNSYLPDYELTSLQELLTLLKKK